MGTSVWTWRDNRFTPLQSLFLPDGSGRDDVVFLLWKGTFSLSKCDGCVKSPDSDHVQNILLCHLKAVSVGEHVVVDDFREQM